MYSMQKTWWKGVNANCKSNISLVCKSLCLHVCKGCIASFYVLSDAVCFLSLIWTMLRHLLHKIPPRVFNFLTDQPFDQMMSFFFFRFYISIESLTDLLIDWLIDWLSEIWSILIVHYSLLLIILKKINRSLLGSEIKSECLSISQTRTISFHTPSK